MKSVASDNVLIRTKNKIPSVGGTVKKKHNNIPVEHRQRKDAVYILYYQQEVSGKGIGVKRQ